MSARHQILPSCGCKAREIVIAKYDIALLETSPVDSIRFIGPLNHIWQRTFPFKALILIFSDMQPLWPSSLTKPDLIRFRCSSGHVLSKTKSVPPFFYISDITSSSSFNGKKFRQKSMLENFRANVLKCIR